MKFHAGTLTCGASGPMRAMTNVMSRLWHHPNWHAGSIDLDAAAKLRVAYSGSPLAQGEIRKD
jgi:hypothetical protein